MKLRPMAVSVGFNLSAAERCDRSCIGLRMHMPCSACIGLRWCTTAKVFCCAAGCVMLQPGAPVHIQNTTFLQCNAWQLGGALCTELDYNREKDLRHLEKSTELRVGADFKGNEGHGDGLFVGPYHNLTDLQGQYMFTDAGQGKVWNSRKCEVGEYIPSLYCELCQPSTYSFCKEPPEKCTVAPNNTPAPGGAVLVPHSSFWHGNNYSLQSCRNCANFNMEKATR